MRAAARVAECEWRSVGQRVGRLILVGTRDRQSDRWDMARMRAELMRLFDAVIDPDSVQAADLLCEEVAVRSDALSGYEWDEGTQTAVIDRGTGVHLELVGLESSRSLVFRLARPRMPFDDRRNFATWIGDAAQAAAKELRAGSWTVDRSETSVSELRLTASIPLAIVQGALDRVSGSLDQSASRLRLE